MLSEICRIDWCPITGGWLVGPTIEQIEQRISRRTIAYEVSQFVSTGKDAYYKLASFAAEDSGNGEFLNFCFRWFGSDY